MSARVSVFIYIVICLEVGVLLALLPWTDYWDENYFLTFVAAKLHAKWLVAALQSGYFKGAVSALGVLNIFAGMRDMLRFRESVSKLSEWESSTNTKN